VGGSPTPDVTGTYSPAGWNDGVRFYQLPGAAYTLFRYTVDHKWYISPTVNVPAANHFLADWGGAAGEDPQYLFDAVGTYTGYALVGTPDTDRVISEHTPPVAPPALGTYTLGGLYQSHPYWNHAVHGMSLYYDTNTANWTVAASPPAGLPANAWMAADRYTNMGPFGTHTGVVEPLQPGA